MISGDWSLMLVRLGVATLAGLVLGFERGGDVRNMTIVASLWLAAAAGIGAGAGQFVLVAAASILALAVLTLVSLVERYMPRRRKRHGGEPEQVTPPNRRGQNPS
jgi:putative Mg2+ transporter-C (MgtC) family protein